MDVSRGRCLLRSLRINKGWSQTELSRRTGYDPEDELEDRAGYSPRMISFFEKFDGKGNGKPMSPEAMYLIARILELPCMDGLYDWIEK